MLWKELAEEESCDNCPLLEAEICTGGFVCYGGDPIEPPCCCFNDDTDLDEWVDNYFKRQKKREEQEEKHREEENKKKERAKKSANTRHRLRIYCMEELLDLKQAKQALKAQLATERLAQSWAEVFNFANEMFRYEDRYCVKPEISESVKRLQEDVEKAEKAYQAKREEFYRKRKAEAREVTS